MGLDRKSSVANPCTCLRNTTKTMGLNNVSVSSTVYCVSSISISHCQLRPKKKIQPNSAQ